MLFEVVFLLLCADFTKHLVEHKIKWIYFLKMDIMKQMSSGQKKKSQPNCLYNFFWVEVQIGLALVFTQENGNTFNITVLFLIYLS